MQIQNLASITQKYPQFPTALSSDLPPPMNRMRLFYTVQR